MHIVYEFFNHDTGEEYDVKIPAHNEVCDRCNGTGKHCNPSIDGNGLTAEDFAEDPDFKEDYLSGMYDVPCYDCGGKNVVLVPNDPKDMNEEQRTALAQMEQRARDRWEDARTMRRESGDWS